MILLSTDEARVVHAVLEFGPQILVSETDQACFNRARDKLVSHVRALVEMMCVSARSAKEPA